MNIWRRVGKHADRLASLRYICIRKINSFASVLNDWVRSGESQGWIESYNLLTVIRPSPEGITPGHCSRGTWGRPYYAAHSFHGMRNPFLPRGSTGYEPLITGKALIIIFGASGFIYDVERRAGLPGCSDMWSPAGIYLRDMRFIWGGIEYREGWLRG